MSAVGHGLYHVTTSDKASSLITYERKPRAVNPTRALMTNRSDRDIGGPTKQRVRAYTGEPPHRRRTSRPEVLLKESREDEGIEAIFLLKPTRTPSARHSTRRIFNGNSVTCRSPRKRNAAARIHLGGSILPLAGARPLSAW